jgi:DNA polymerase delta subunit 1
MKVECKHTSIEAMTDSPWNKIAPLTIFSFDIECNPKQDFPTELNDEVITIGCVQNLHRKNEKKIILSQKQCPPIAEVYVELLQSEIDILRKFDKILMSYDPDFVKGYNLINFDLKYILNRAHALALEIMVILVKIPSILRELPTENIYQRRWICDTK